MDEKTLTAVVTIVASGMGLFGALSGIFLNEFFNRRRRVETYAQKIFDRRLEVHEKLLALINEAGDVFNGILEDRTLSPQQRESLMGVAIMKLANYTDANKLYLDEYVAVNATGIFIGTDDVASMENEAERKEAAAEVMQDCKIARDMIVAESGLGLVNKHFRTVTGSKPDSRLINHLKKLQGEGKRKRRE